MTNMPIRHHFNLSDKYQIYNNIYLHDLQMYIIPPSGYIELEELQHWCINRLKVLKLVEQISIQNYKKSPKDCLAALIEELERNGLHSFVKLINDCKCKDKTKQILRRNDCISHFTLRSALCFEVKKREWFFKQEVKLFKWRFSSLNKESIKKFIDINGFQLFCISEEEKHKIKECLEISCIAKNIYKMKFYKIHFTKVINLIIRRQVFLQDGSAYVPETKILYLVLSEFKKTLNEGFRHSREMASNIYDDERITKFLTIISKSIDTTYFKYDKYKQISINELDELSRTSYPLCMRLLHEALKVNHHLTNGGRVQYCLFLKGIGLSLKNALKFWKNEFTRKIDEVTFDKKYKYHIRHLYGKEGKRANYEPFHCSKIQNSTVCLRDKHGCPFKCMASDTLQKTLFKCGLVHPDVECVMQLSKAGSYVKACKKYYETTHNCIVNNTFNHPNIYFNCSRKKFENIYSDSED